MNNTCLPLSALRHMEVAHSTLHSRSHLRNNINEMLRYSWVLALKSTQKQSWGSGLSSSPLEWT